MGLFYRQELDELDERLASQSRRQRRRENRRMRRESRARRRREVGFLARWLVRAVMAFILVPVALAGAGVGALAAWVRNAPPIEEFEAYTPPEATIVYDREGERIAVLFEQKRFVVPLAELPLVVPNAFIAMEDSRYFLHFGVDPIGVVRAAWVNLTRGRTAQGASTITQQTARNLLPQIGWERSAQRKIAEALVALQMERHYTKEQILEVYLNQIYLGSGTYGVEAASRAYFGKSARELTLEEAALLAGLPQIPERFSPLNNPDLSRWRRDLVLGRMWVLDYIEDRDFDRAVLSDVQLNPDVVPRGEASYFVDAVRRAVTGQPEFRGLRLQSAGWHLETTVNRQAQATAERVLAEGLEQEELAWISGRQERWGRWRSRDDHWRPPEPGQRRMGEVVRTYGGSIIVELPGGWRGDLTIPQNTAHFFTGPGALAPGEGVDIAIEEINHERGLFRGRLLPRIRLQGALVSMDVRTGEVLALAGGRAYPDPENNGFFNRAVQARRQGGSTMKPFFFAAALENGMTPESIVQDSPIVFRDGYAPRNYENRFFGPTTLTTALRRSRNVPTLRVVQRTGLRRALEFVSRFERTGERKWELPMEWPVVLGTTEVTPLELAAAYQVIANRGLARGPRLVRRIENQAGREILRVPVPPEEQIMDRRTAEALVRMMEGVFRDGTGESLLPMLPSGMEGRIAGKSGTTNRNQDAWFAGFSPQEAVVVWVGFDRDLPLAPGRTGARAAGPIWTQYMTERWNQLPPERRSEYLPGMEPAITARR